MIPKPIPMWGERAEFATNGGQSPLGENFSRGAKSSQIYRADIDGLRGLAVLAVLLFHAGFATLSGGFVGVDVFFVVSGFLITQIIVKELDGGRFSLMTFYARRVRRIFPAILVVVLACAVAGYLVFLPEDYRTFGRNAFATTVFGSNILFWLNTGYFDGPSQYKSLLHTWSLAVEEQFYLFFPLLMMVLWRWARERLKQIILGIALLSLGASILTMQFLPDSTAPFYLMPFRAWELLLGSLLALGLVRHLSSAQAREWTAALGLALIAFAAFTYSELTVFPGLMALAPCIGTAMIIHAGTGGTSRTGKLLAWQPLVFVGLISYSLYLWHWPIFVFARYLVIDKLTMLDSLLLVLASLAVATLSWRFIENPFRKSAPRRSASGPVVLGGAFASMLVAILGLSIYRQEGLPDRFSSDVTDLSSYAASLNPKADMCKDVRLQLGKDSPCTIGSTQAAQQFLWGDSHAGTLYGALKDIALTGPDTVYGATPRCPPLLGVGTDHECMRGNWLRLKYILDRPEIDTVIIGARWSLYLKGRETEFGPAETNGHLPELQDERGKIYEPLSREAQAAFARGLQSSVDRLLSHGKRVVLVYPVPELGYDIPSTSARLAAQGVDPAKFVMPAQHYYRRQAEAFQILDGLGKHPGLIRIYPAKIFCPREKCLAVKDGKPLYFDSNHLSIPGSSLLTPSIKEAITARGS